METLRQANDKLFPLNSLSSQVEKGCLGTKATGRHTQIPFRTQRWLSWDLLQGTRPPTRLPLQPPAPTLPLPRSQVCILFPLHYPAHWPCDPTLVCTPVIPVEAETWPLGAAHVCPQCCVITERGERSGGRRGWMQGRDEPQHKVWLQLASSILPDSVPCLFYTEYKWVLLLLNLRVVSFIKGFKILTTMS